MPKVLADCDLHSWLEAEDYVRLGPKPLANKPLLEVVHHKSEKNFEVHLILLLEENQTPLDIRWTQRWWVPGSLFLDF